MREAVPVPCYTVEGLMKKLGIEGVRRGTLYHNATVSGGT